MKPITKYSLIFAYFFIYLSVVAVDYNSLERSLNNMNKIDVFYYILKPLYSLFCIPPILIYLYGYKNVKIWFIFVFYIIVMKVILGRYPILDVYPINILQNELNNRFQSLNIIDIVGILIYIIITSILIIRKIKIRKYIYGTLILSLSMLLVFLSERNDNNIERQECLEQKRELIWCKEYYYTDHIFYDKLEKLEK